MKGIELANYIVSKQIEEGRPTNTLSLQKVMYYVNAKYMHENNNPIPLITDGFEKWKFGPVNPDVYHEYSFYGSLPISGLPFTQMLYWDEDDFAEDLSESGLSLEKLNSWIDEFISYDRFDLVEATHRHDVWKKDESAINRGVQGLAYSNEEIFDEIVSNPETFFKVN